MWSTCESRNSWASLASSMEQLAEKYVERPWRRGRGHGKAHDGGSACRTQPLPQTVPAITLQEEQGEWRPEGTHLATKPQVLLGRLQGEHPLATAVPQPLHLFRVLLEGLACPHQQLQLLLEDQKTATIRAQPREAPPLLRMQPIR